jgi:O-acetylhomoserine (thiol)-lyase
VLEERMAALDHGVGAVVTASGQAALHLAITTILSAGDHIVSSRSIYGGTHNLLEYTLSRFGITTTFVDPRDPSAFADAIEDNTRLIFGEVLGNPGLEVLDIPKIADVAHANKLPLLIDATFVTPYLCQPIELGADLVVHSATKFLSGHGVVVGGVVVDGGTFDWQSSDKFPTLSQPYVGFHNLVFADEFGPAAFITRARKEGIRDFGACMAPMTAFQILQGLETLPLRMAKHVSNALEVASFLEQHEMVLSVSHPGLPSHPDHELAQRMLPKGCGAVFSFELKGGREAGRVFIESLNVFSHLANVGDAKSLVIHPASTTHHRVDEASLLASGIGPGLVRLSVGLEDSKDLINDLKGGLRAVEKMHKRQAAKESV